MSRSRPISPLNIAPLFDDPGVGLVNCFYRLANPSTLAMQWEAVAINADFWAQVLQARSLRPVDFALGAVMTLPAAQLKAIGGFAALSDFLADDYQLGRQVARQKKRIEFATVVAECWETPMNWRQVWAHQSRWARTIRVCQPFPFFLSILNNSTLWPLLWLAAARQPAALAVCAACVLFRVGTALQQQSRLAQSPAAPGLRLDAAGQRPVGCPGLGRGLLRQSNHLARRPLPNSARRQAGHSRSAQAGPRVYRIRRDYCQMNLSTE